jgi:hypothetical protein
MRQAAWPNSLISLAFHSERFLALISVGAYAWLSTAFLSALLIGAAFVVAVALITDTLPSNLENRKAFSLSRAPAAPAALCCASFPSPFLSCFAFFPLASFLLALAA